MARPDWERRLLIEKYANEDVPLDEAKKDLGRVSDLITKKYNLLIGTNLDDSWIYEVLVNTHKFLADYVLRHSRGF